MNARCVPLLSALAALAVVACDEHVDPIHAESGAVVGGAVVMRVRNTAEVALVGFRGTWDCRDAYEIRRIPGHVLGEDYEWIGSAPPRTVAEANFQIPPDLGECSAISFHVDDARFADGTVWQGYMFWMPRRRR